MRAGLPARRPIYLRANESGAIDGGDAPRKRGVFFFGNPALFLLYLPFPFPPPPSHFFVWDKRMFFAIYDKGKFGERKKFFAQPPAARLYILRRQYGAAVFHIFMIAHCCR